jgi:hypothetical protein
MRVAVTVAFASLFGCGPSQESFVEKYVAAECDYRIACYAPDILEFYGYSDVAGCTASFGPEYVTDHQGCTYDKKSASNCVKALEGLACPADGEDPADPDVCSQVLTGCTDGSDTDVADTDAG